MVDGWKRNGTGLKSEDFFDLFQLKGYSFSAVKDSEGLFESTVFEAVQKNDLLVPSLGDVIDYVNLNPLINGELIRNYLQKNVLITSSGIETNNEGYYVRGYQLNKNMRIKKGIQPEEERGVVFRKLDEWIDIKNENLLNYENKNILEIIINRNHANILTALDGIDTKIDKKVFVSSRALKNSSLSLLIYNNELIIYKHDICGGEFCIM